MDESAKDKFANDCYRKGAEAMNKHNWDYAIDMFGQATRLSPDNVVFRQARHGCIRKKYDENGSGAKMASMKLVKIRARVKKSRIKKDWEEVDRAAEDGLAVNPWDPQLYFDLAESCRGRELENTAVYAFKKAVEYAPDNIGFNRALGHLLWERGEYPEARACFHRIYQIDKNDSEARQIMGKIDADSVLDRSGYEKAENTEDVKSERVNAYEADRRARKEGMEAKADGPGQSEEADLQRALRKTPEDINSYLKLADYYRNSKKLEEAKKVFEQAIEKFGEDANTVEQMEDVELEMLRNEAGAAKDEARKTPDDEKLRKLAAKLNRKLVEREIEVLSTRIERYPNDMRLKYELAQRYKRVGDFAKAIPLLQQASGDSRLKEDVLVGLGECFIKDRKLDLGRRQFEKAIQTLNHTDKPDQFKTAHYWLGRLYEKAKQTDKAEDHYHEILGVDWEYKDVRARLEAIQGDDDELGVGDLD